MREVYALVHICREIGEAVLKWAQNGTMIPFQHPNRSKIFVEKTHF